MRPKAGFFWTIGRELASAWRWARGSARFFDRKINVD
jgi:hypothetical protein